MVWESCWEPSNVQYACNTVSNTVFSFCNGRSLRCCFWWGSLSIVMLGAVWQRVQRMLHIHSSHMFFFTHFSCCLQLVPFLMTPWRNWNEMEPCWCKDCKEICGRLGKNNPICIARIFVTLRLEALRANACYTLVTWTTLYSCYSPSLPCSARTWWI